MLSRGGKSGRQEGVVSVCGCSPEETKTEPSCEGSSGQREKKGERDKELGSYSLFPFECAVFARRGSGEEN